VAQGLSMDLSAHNYGTSMLDMELTSSEHCGIMILESRSEESAEAPRAPTPPAGRVGGDDPAVAPQSPQWPS
jgi:hypothetical protein